MFNINKLSTFLLLLILSISSNLFSQSEEQRIRSLRFYPFAIEDSISASNDSIRFIISDSLGITKPVVIFLRGEGNLPLIEYDKNRTWLNLPFRPYDKDFHFVFISKPGIPVSAPYRPRKNSNVDTTLVGWDIYMQNNCKDYYVDVTNCIIEYLKKQTYVDSTKIYLMGHSVGASVGAKLGAIYPNSISKLVFMSSNLFAQGTDAIINNRKSAFEGKISFDSAQINIESIYQSYTRNEQIMTEPISDEEITALNFNYSIDSDPNLRYLMQLEIPLHVVYGSADTKSLDLDLLPLLFLQNRKTNLTTKVYPGLDNNYFKIDKLGQPIYHQFYWGTVFENVLRWLKEQPPLK